MLIGRLRETLDICMLNEARDHQRGDKADREQRHHDGDGEQRFLDNDDEQRRHEGENEQRPCDHNKERRRLAAAWIAAKVMYRGEWEILHVRPHDRTTAIYLPEWIDTRDI